MLNIAGADAFINCWDDKAYWSFWRPITAIRDGDDDGNPKTEGDSSWTPLLAAAAVSRPSVRLQLRHRRVHAYRRSLLRQEEADLQTWSGIAPDVPDVTRDYEQFTDVIDDTIDARVYQGIHFRTADIQGAEIGKDVARWLDKHYFQPVK